MGKTRTTTSKNETSANSSTNTRSRPSKVNNFITSQQQQHQHSSPSTNLSRKKQPNVASAGLAFLVAGGYTPLPLSTGGFEGSSLGVNHYSSSAGGTVSIVVGGATSPAPLTEIGTSWSTRWESCQMMREQNVMVTNTNKKQLPTMGEAKIDWNLLIRLRNWVVRVILNQRGRNDEAKNKNAKEAIRCLLLGVPFSGSILADEGFIGESNRLAENGLIELNTASESCANKTAGNNALSKKEQAEQQQKRLELIAETEDWNLLLDAAKEQIVNVFDPFLEQHLLKNKKDDEEGDDEQMVNQD